MKLREFVHTDTERCVEIWYEASVLAHEFIPKEIWEGHKDEIKNTYLKISQTWVAEDDGKVLGLSP